MNNGLGSVVGKVFGPETVVDWLGGSSGSEIYLKIK